MERTNDSGEAPILRVGDLRVTFATDDGPAVAVDGLSFDLFPGETVGIVGESGSGKSATAMALLGLLPGTATVTGSIAFGEQELLGAPERELRAIRGNRIAMVFQDALAALNPAHTVGRQLTEAIRVHDRAVPKAELRARAIELLETVGIPSARQRADQYPHEFSGGMRQRVMIAMSIANDPDVIIADEPTTALDVTVQAQVLEVLRAVQERTRAAVLLITHDLGVVAGLADRVLVMYAGGKVEEAAVEPLFALPSHPYTQGLLQSLPRLDDDGDDGRLRYIPGRPPNPTALPAGCRFLPRCPHALAGLCDSDPLPLATVGAGHVAACARIDAAREGWS
ncbi:ABC transporter ATP-binding protein [Conexibacter stalactiti]|uniref:ABC transporter ATP-binding protein n=1 Tax=Conexibacter stalactiti TaxID=1940611 RepID=A0ABU4HNZ2_9ACTN|nr:ABC transporter ATP-binding protein [Conexibacter stalactiti]MDW5595021.1 ABC transporter ATP-binding protein [Conexibacter stalactiti]MEC5035663.1 ABC transporter ATP-binding protein [Conexibacter stalactiti]